MTGQLLYDEHVHIRYVEKIIMDAIVLLVFSCTHISSFKILVISNRSK